MDDSDDVTTRRGRALRTVRARLRRCADGDEDSVLGPDALLDAVRLLAATTDLAEDTDAARTAGLLFWCRSGLTGADDDLMAALALRAPVWRRKPAAVPEEVAEVLAEYGLDLVAAADAWHGPALALAAHVRRSPDPAQHAVVVELLRRAVSATPAGGVEYGQCLSNLATALQRRFECTLTARARWPTSGWRGTCARSAPGRASTQPWTPAGPRSPRRQRVIPTWPAGCRTSPTRS